ncbi:hypothetical protein LLE49_28040, partial [Alicyclobacillus tolerans]|nr:hypothetical protein [Alicyclobacillus tolerans]
ILIRKNYLTLWRNCLSVAAYLDGHGVAPTTTEFAVAQDVFEVSNSVLDELNLTVTVTRSDVTNLPQYAGPSYGKPTPESLQAINKLAQLEGILLDPIYTGKAMAGLLDQVRSGDRQGPIIFWHTGGIPAIFAFPEHWITEP